MNEILQNAVADLLKKTLTSIETAGAFLASETPEYVNQLLRWHFLYNLIGFILCTVGIIIVIGSFIWGCRKGGWIVNPDGTGIFSIFLLFPIGLMTAGMLNTIQWLQILIAPKVWLVNYITTLIK